MLSANYYDYQGKLIQDNITLYHSNNCVVAVLLLQVFY